MTHPPSSYGYGTPPAHMKKKSKGWAIGCGITALLSVVVVGSCSVLIAKTTASNLTLTPAPTNSDGAKGASIGAHVGQAPAKSAKPKAMKPVLVLDEQGTGIKSTRSFTVSGDWDLAWSYKCSVSQGYFGVSGQDGMPLVNEMGLSGSDTTHQHDGPGKTYLQVNAGCSWKIRAYQLPS